MLRKMKKGKNKEQRNKDGNYITFHRRWDRWKYFEGESQELEAHKIFSETFNYFQ